MLGNQRIDILHGIFAEDAIDMAIRRNDMAAIQAGPVRLLKQGEGLGCAFREKTRVLLAVDERDGNSQPLQMRQVRLLAVGGDQMARLGQQRQVSNARMLAIPNVSCSVSWVSEFNCACS